MIYYRRYVGDYLRDTSRLSILEHGAYTLLLDYYYAEERPISTDSDEVYRMVRALMPEERQAIDKVLATFFVRQSDGYRHKRVDHEIQVSQQARKNGRQGGRPVTGLLTGIDTETGTVLVTTDGGGSGHPPTTNHQPSTINHQPRSTASSAGLTEILPSNIPYKELVALFNEHMTALPRVRELTQKRRALIRSAWTASKRRQTMKFWKQYFEECSDDDFLNGTGPYGKGHENWQPTFDFLMRSDQITKTYEKSIHLREQGR